MRVGIREDHDPSETKTRFPQATYTRTFIGDVLAPGSLIQGFTYYAQPSWNAGMVPIVTFKPKPADVSAGTWDPYLKEIAQFLKTKPETLVVPWHEPEDDHTGSVFSQMFKRVRDVLKGEFPELRVGYAAMAYQWNPKWNNPNTSVAGRTDYPASWRIQADFYAVDVYSGFEYPVNTILPEISGFKRWARLLAPTGLPIFITERGFKVASSDPAVLAERATAIRRELAWLQSDDPLAKRIEAYVYWSSTGVENDPLMVLDELGEVALGELFSAVTTTQTYQAGYKSATTKMQTALNVIAQEA